MQQPTIEADGDMTLITRKVVALVQPDHLGAYECWTLSVQASLFHKHAEWTQSTVGGNNSRHTQMLLLSRVLS